MIWAKCDLVHFSGGIGDLEMEATTRMGAIMARNRDQVASSACIDVYLQVSTSPRGISVIETEFWHAEEQLGTERRLVEGASHPVAQHLALESALFYLSKVAAHACLQIWTSSELLVRQHQGAWRVRGEHLRPIFDRCRALMCRFLSVRFLWTDEPSSKEAK